MVIKINRQIEVIEKEGEIPELRVKKCKTMRKALETLIAQQTKKGNYELVFYTKGILKLYNKHHPERIVDVEIESWHKHSSFEVIREIDKIRIIKYQKPNRSSEPVKIETEASQEELTALIDSINFLWENRKNEEGIKTSALSMLYSKKMNLNHSGWRRGENPFFSDRKSHNHLTLMLGALDKLKLVKYEGGYTTPLNNKINIQMVLT